MSLTLHVPESRDLKPRLTVFGVGGAGGNAVNNMIARNLEGVEFVVANTDAQSLTMSQAENKVQLGEQLTEGLGAGAKPEIGARAAEESLEKITDFLMGSHMCFITAGMGGGTGTGAAPVIASAARQMGILTVGVVTKPFLFEGSRRMKQADAGIEELQQYVDTLIVIPNQNLFRIASEKTTFTEAFGMADDVLYQGVKGVTDLMVRPGMVNLDFADIRSVMDEMGKAMMGTGEAEGEDRATLAAERAIANPLLDEISLHGARGVLINITGGDDMTLHEVDEASNKIRNEVDPDANIIFGTTFDPQMTGAIRVSVVATGIDVEEVAKAKKRGKTSTSSVSSSVTSEGDLFAHSTQRQAPKVEAKPKSTEVSYVEDNSRRVERETQNHVQPQTENYDHIEVADDQGELFSGMADDQRDEQDFFEAEPVVSDEPVPTDRYEAPRREYVEDDHLLEERKLAMRERIRDAAQATPVSAPPADDYAVEKAESNTRRFTLDNLVKRMSGHDEQPKNVAEHHSSYEAERQRTRPESIAPARRAEQPQMMTDDHLRPRMEDREHNRVDIPAFLRRKAN